MFSEKSIPSFAILFFLCYLDCQLSNNVMTNENVRKLDNVSRFPFLKIRTQGRRESGLTSKL